MDGDFLSRSRWWAAGVLLVVLILAGAVLAAGQLWGSRSGDDGRAGDGSPPGYLPGEVATIGDSGCPVFPADNVWHSVIDDPDVPLGAPDDARVVMLGSADGAVRAAFGADRGEGLNVVPTEDASVETFAVASNWLAPSNLGHARSTDAERARLELGAFPRFTFDLLAPPVEELRWTHMSLDPSTDNRLYLVDTEECISSEFAGFNGLLALADRRAEANRLSQFDLRSNNRRLSRTWGEGPCPDVPPNEVFEPGCDGTEEKPGSARGGSGLSGLGGLLRVDEVESSAGVDHAVSVVLPKNLVSADSAVWPATITDGVGEVGTFSDAPEGAAPIPMGARLRLSEDFELDCAADECPQSTAVVDALRRHGAIVVDSMGPVEELGDAGMHLVGEMSSGWDRQDLRRIEVRDDGSPAMRLSDFELVEAQDMRALPDATPQDDGWLQVR